VRSLHTPVASPARNAASIQSRGLDLYRPLESALARVSVIGRAIVGTRAPPRAFR
jgi:hypothetical protein